LIPSIVGVIQRWVRNSQFKLFSEAYEGNQAANFYLETEALGSGDKFALLRELNPTWNLRPEKVVWRIRSCDQGWVDAPTRQLVGGFFGSNTWFDATVFRQKTGPESRNESSSSSVLGGQKLSPFETLALTDMARAVPAAPRDDSPLFFFTSCPEDCVEMLDGGGWQCLPNRHCPGASDESKPWRINWLIQRNRVAGGGPEEFEIKWDRSTKHDSDAFPSSEEIEGTGEGNGLGFIESLQVGDRIGVWARTRVSQCRCPILRLYTEIE
jgi:hypothetical protein